MEEVIKAPPLPKPRAGETTSAFISRCISFAVDEGMPQTQAVAACYTAARRAGRKVKPPPKEEGEADKNWIEKMDGLEVKEVNDPPKKEGLDEKKKEGLDELLQDNPSRFQTDNLGRSGEYVTEGVVVGGYPELGEVGKVPKRMSLDEQDDLDELLPIK